MACSYSEEEKEEAASGIIMTGKRPPERCIKDCARIFVDFRQ
jgi:hypothetical protein